MVVGKICDRLNTIFFWVPSYSREPCFKKVIQVKEMKCWSPSKEQKIIHGQELIEDFCERMCLSQNVQVLASDLIYQIIDTKPLLGKCLKILVATILYISAKTCRTPRSVKELCNILSMKKKNVNFKKFFWKRSICSLPPRVFFKRWESQIKTFFLVENFYKSMSFFISSAFSRAIPM